MRDNAWLINVWHNSGVLFLCKPIYSGFFDSDGDVEREYIISTEKLNQVENTYFLKPDSATFASDIKKGGVYNYMIEDIPKTLVQCFMFCTRPY